MLPFWAEALSNLIWLIWGKWWQPSAQRCRAFGFQGDAHRTSGKFEMSLLCLAEIFSPQWRWHSKHMFNTQMCLSNGKKNQTPTHLEMLKWLWERIHVQERIQKGGHKCALWILGKDFEKEEGSRLSPFLCSCPMLCMDWTISSHSPQKEVGKCQWCQSSEDDKEINKTKRKKKLVAIFPNNSRNTNMVL